MNTAQKLLVSGAVGVAAVLGGALGASLVGTAGATPTVVAQTTTDPTTVPADPGATDPGATTTPDEDGGRGRHHGGGKGGPHQANGITETELTGDQAAQAIAAAEAAVPGGTAERAETDAEGAAYEVHVTDADGNEVTVKLDAGFVVTETIQGRG